MVTILIMSVVMMVSLLFTYSDVALSASNRNEGTLYMLPCVLPLSLRRTSLDTSELKVVKLFHLSGRPRSWTLYNILNFAYLLLPHFKVLVYRNPHVGDSNMLKTFQNAI
jgi:hypothetical protein